MHNSPYKHLRWTTDYRITVTIISTADHIELALHISGYNSRIKEMHSICYVYSNEVNYRIMGSNPIQCTRNNSVWKNMTTVSDAKNWFSTTVTLICLYLHSSVWLVVVHDGLLKMSPCWLLPDFYVILPVAAIVSDPKIAPCPLYSALLWVSAAATYLYSKYTLI